MVDLVIRGATIVDGLGHEPKRADLAVKDGRIAGIGEIKDKGAETIDADGLVLSPGHRRRAHALRCPGHLGCHALAVAVARRHDGGDGQLRLRHRAAPRGRGARPGDPQPLGGRGHGPRRAAQGITWDFESFGDYMAMLRRRGAYANVAVLAGHSTIRTAVMGEDASQRGDATPEELARMKAMVADAMDNGAIGLGASYSLNHSGYGGVPMPSTIAPICELDALVGAMGPRGRGVIAIASGVKTPQELEPMAAKYGRPFFQGTGMAMYNEQEPARALKHLRRLRGRLPARQRALCPDPLPAACLRLHDGQRLPVLQPLGLRSDQGLHAGAAQGRVPRSVVARQVPRERQEPAAGHDLPGQLGSRDGGRGPQALERQVCEPLSPRDRQGRAPRSAGRHARSQPGRGPRDRLPRPLPQCRRRGRGAPAEARGRAWWRSPTPARTSSICATRASACISWRTGCASAAISTWPKASAG